MSLYLWGRTDFNRSVSSVDDSAVLEFPVRIPQLPTSAPITSIAVGEQHCVFIAGGELFGLGSNKHRQLHHLERDVCDAPIRIALPSSATGRPLRVACGASHSLVLLDDGSVMSAGLNDMDQLGHVVSAKEKATGEKWRPWARVALSVSAQKIFAAGNASFILHEGSIYSWGSQRHGHLGHGTTGELERETSGVATRFDNVKYPTKIQWFAAQKLRVVDIAVGPAHMLACTENGEVYAVGDNSYGKLGIRSVSMLTTPQRVAIFSASDAAQEKLVGIAAGADQSFAIRQQLDGSTVVYAWGLINRDSSSSPTQIAWGVPADTAFIVGGFDFQLLVRKTGQLLSWGFPRQAYGCTNAMQSCDPSHPPHKRFPAVVTCMDGKFVVHAAVGKTFAAIVCDDSKFVQPPDGPRENQSLYCMVPKAHRYPTGFNAKLTPNRFEEAILRFYKRLYTAEDAAKFFEQIPVASEAPPEKKISIVKRGAKSLRPGSKVRVWMEDVYAWGTILGHAPEGLYPPSSFDVKWVREDWDPEVVQLNSDDETLDENNEARWQHLWVLDDNI